mgnify:CR=1 FL=1
MDKYANQLLEAACLATWAGMMVDTAVAAANHAPGTTSKIIQASSRGDGVPQYVAVFITGEEECALLTAALDTTMRELAKRRGCTYTATGVGEFQDGTPVQVADGQSLRGLDPEFVRRVFTGKRGEG